MQSLRVAIHAVVFLLLYYASAIAGFTNGGFEASPDFSGWTLEGFLNPGLKSSTPSSYADINFSTPGPITSVVTSSFGTDPNAPISFPKFGNKTAVVRGDIGSKMNRIRQSITLSAVDKDSDGFYHIRFAYAPIADNPAHNPNEQPFFFVGVNKAGVSLYSKFYFAQSASQWKTAASGALYMDWQYVDISSKNVLITAGDTIDVIVVAAGCSLGGHASKVYVDGFGSKSLFIEKTADKTDMYAGDNLTYTFKYANMGTSAISGVIAKETIPANTTFVSLSDPVNCSQAAGAVTCNLGTLNPGDEGTFDVTVNVNPAAVGTVLNDTYTIEGTSYAPVNGAPVTTNIVIPIHTELSITNTDNQLTFVEGQTLSYNVVAMNTGPADATGGNSPKVKFAFPPELTNVTWTCSASAGSSCGVASGNGAFNNTVQILNGGNLTYTIAGTVSAVPPASLTTTATITPAAGINDDPANNASVDTDTYNNSYSINASAGQGGAISPAGLATVNLNDTPAYTVTLLTGFHIADIQVDDVSIGAVSSYTFAPVKADHSIEASFAIDTYKITASGGAGGTISPAGVTTLNYGVNQTYSITPQSGYRIADVLVDGKSVGAVAYYSFSKLTANHTIAVTFIANTYTIFAAASTGGTITPAGYLTVPEGGSQKYVFAPQAGYMITDVKINGISKGSLPYYQFTSVKTNQTINVIFAPEKLMIVATAGTGGSISPVGNTAIARGGSRVFSLLPSAGFKVANVFVDGTSVGPVTSYTFNNVQTAHTISATFTKSVVTATSYKISSTVIGLGGVVLPTGNVLVLAGQSQTFSFIPNSNYIVSDVNINGVSIGSKSSYTFSNVSANQSLSVTFSK